MYCSTCGNKIDDHLNYCNSCGSRIEKNPLIVSNSSSRIFGKAAGAIGVVGLIGVYPILRTLLDSRLDQAAILMILLAYLVTLFLLFAVLIGHVWKNSGDIRIKAKNTDDRDEYVRPTSFRAVNTSQLEAATSPPISVTEHTTRTLDRVPVRER